MFRCQRQKKIRQVQMQDAALGPFPYARAMRQHNIFAFPFLPSLSYQTGAVARKQVQCTEQTKCLKLLCFLCQVIISQNKQTHPHFFSQGLFPGIQE